MPDLRMGQEIFRHDVATGAVGTSLCRQTPELPVRHGA
jgi:hypothetical protein